jgi:aldose 1-epimerase
MTATITQATAAQHDDGPVTRYELSNGTVSTAILSWGAIIQELHVPGRDGTAANVVLGFRDVARYFQKHPHFGAVVGRYGNRIAGGRFPLDGREVQVTPNKGTFTLHGGERGFDYYNWESDPIEEGDTVGVRLTRTSPDGEEGFPGTLTATVAYRLTPDNALRLDYEVTTDAPTVHNLTNHSYFNLAGEGSGTVEGHVLQVHASRITATNEQQIPTGELAEVAGTPLDYRQPHAIGDALRDASSPEIVRARGIDHNYVIDRSGNDDGLVLAARVSDPASGRVMTVETTQPGVQVYTGNSLDGGVAGYSGRLYRQTDAVCFETQHFPDSPNQPAFPSTVLRPGEVFRSTTIYRFATE